MRARVFFGSLALAGIAAACAPFKIEPVPPRPLPVAIGEPGECEAGEYVLPSGDTFDVDVRVIADDQGRPLSVSLARGHDPRSNELALDLGRNLFACSHPLALEAARVIPSWPVHFRPLAIPRPLDPEACKRAIKYPHTASTEDLEGSVRLRVAVDATGRVRRAWTHKADTSGFVEAAIEAAERCLFTPVGDVATVLTWDVDFQR